jgi:hypothetical protein
MNDKGERMEKAEIRESGFNTDVFISVHSWFLGFDLS